MGWGEGRVGPKVPGLKKKNRLRRTSRRSANIKRTRVEKEVYTYIYIYIFIYTDGEGGGGVYIRFYGEFNNPKTAFFRCVRARAASFRN